MKSIALTLSPLLFAAALHAADTVTYMPVPNASKLRMDGDSTIHKWHAETAVIGGSIIADKTFPESAKGATAPVNPKVEVKIRVVTLKSSSGRKMDEKMLEAMKGGEHKTIDYRVLEMTPKPGGTGNAVNFEAKGALTVAGVTRTNTMPVAIERVAPTRLKVTGVIPLKMTDHGIKPPAPEILGMSLIKTDDNVKITYEWVVEQARPQ